MLYIALDLARCRNIQTRNAFYSSKTSFTSTTTTVNAAATVTTTTDASNNRSSWDIEIQMDYPIPARKPDQSLIHKKKRTC